MRERIVARLREKGAEVLVAGIQAPRNYGGDYAARFEAIFPDLAREHGALLHPFFLDGVVQRSAKGPSARPDLVLDDGLHPNARGVAAIVASILPAVEELIARARAKRPG